MLFVPPSGTTWSLISGARHGRESTPIVWISFRLFPAPKYSNAWRSAKNPRARATGTLRAAAQAAAWNVYAAHRIEEFGPKSRTKNTACAQTSPEFSTHKIRPNVRFDQIATQLLRGSGMTRRATRRHLIIELAAPTCSTAIG
jgi:hypothetical protein